MNDDRERFPQGPRRDTSVRGVGIALADGYRVVDGKRIYGSRIGVSVNGGEHAWLDLDQARGLANEVLSCIADAEPQR